MFCGESGHTLDKKHRVFVPKRFHGALDRDEAGQFTVVLTRGFDGCLFLFSDKGFREAAAALQTQAFAQEKARTMQRLFFANAHRCQLDASGRLVLPEKLRKLAGIGSEVVMVGVLERAEIWDKTKWEAFEAANGESFDDLADVLAPQGGAGADTAGGGGG